MKKFLATFLAVVLLCPLIGFHSTANAVSNVVEIKPPMRKLLPIGQTY